jgi:hypothetical protein
MKLILIFLFTLSLFTAFSQDETDSGAVIIKNKEIEDFIKTRSTYSRISNEGYRLQVYYNSDKKMVNSQRMKFIKKYRELETLITYDSPNYILRAGDFMNKNEAEEARKKIRKNFPEAFVIKTKINIPKKELQKMKGKNKSK